MEDEFFGSSIDKNIRACHDQLSHELGYKWINHIEVQLMIISAVKVHQELTSERMIDEKYENDVLELFEEAEKRTLNIVWCLCLCWYSECMYSVSRADNQLLYSQIMW